MGAPRLKHATVSDSYVVESTAVEVVRSLLPPSAWLWRQQSPDYFVDYVIETTRDGEPTGFQFGVQIKGTRTLSVRKNTVRFRMERKPLLYYRDSAEFPIFIVIVNVQAQAAYWVLAQQYLRERADSARFESKNTLTIVFPLENCLSDSARFVQALDEARAYMRELNPGSVAAATRHRQHTLQQLDPNVRVDVSAERGVEVLHLRPNAPISFTFSSRSRDARSRFRLLNERGEPFDSEMELVQAPDSKLFRELIPLGSYRVRVEPPSRAGTVQLSWQSAAGADFLQVEGTWRGGCQAARFVGALPNAPLTVELTVDRGSNDEDFRFGIATPLRFATWEGQAVTELAWFLELHSLFGTLCSGADVSVTYLSEGTRVGRGLLSATTHDTGSDILRFLDWLSRVRWLARHYDVPHLTLPKISNIGDDAEHQTNALWALTNGQSFVHEIPEATFSFSTEGGAPLPERWSDPANQGVGSVSISGNSTFDLLGHTIDLPDVENIFTAVKIASVDPVSNSTRRITFRGQNDARWVRRRTRSSARKAT